jgi:hypothetical protein
VVVYVGDDQALQFPRASHDGDGWEDAVTDHAARRDEQQELGPPRPPHRDRLPVDRGRVGGGWRLGERGSFVVHLEGPAGAEPQVESADLARERHDHHAEHQHEEPQHRVRRGPPTLHSRTFLTIPTWRTYRLGCAP